MAAYFIPNITLESFGISQNWLTEMSWDFSPHSVDKTDFPNDPPVGMGDDTVQGILLNDDVFNDFRSLFSDPRFDLDSLIVDGLYYYRTTEKSEVPSRPVNIGFNDERLALSVREIKNTLGRRVSGRFYFPPTIVNAEGIIGSEWTMEDVDEERDDNRGRLPLGIYININITSEEQDGLNHYTTATGEYLIDAPESLFGYPISAGSKILAPSTNPRITRNIVSPEGTVVAQVTDKAIFVLLPMAIPVLLQQDNRGSRILNEVLKYIVTTLGECYAPKDIPLDKFTEVANTLILAEKKNAAARVEKYKDEVESYQTNLANALRSYQKYSRMVAGLDNSMPTEDTIKVELAVLAQMKNVESIMFRDDGVVVVRTPEIIWEETHPNDPIAKGVKYRFFGKARIEINPTDINPNTAIRWFNESIDQNEWPHNHPFPHVESNGTACLGNMSEMLTQVVGSFELAMMIQLAVRFAETANIGDQYGDYARDYPAWTPPVEEVVAEEKPKQKQKRKRAPRRASTTRTRRTAA